MTGEHGGAFQLQDVTQYAGFRRGDFQHDFIGFDVNQHFVTGNQITRFLVPGGDGGVRH
ncbi:hypothetical protein D3C81_533570 [compost metagenome]